MNWNLPTNPFVGLRPFESNENLLFFGRHDQVRDLLSTLHTTRFLAVVGSSGSGKSSLIRAGLIPNLQAGYLVEERDEWYIAKMSPGETPLHNLAAAVLGALPEETMPEQLAAFEQDIRMLGVQTILAILAILDRRTSPLVQTASNFLLLVDQFEEIFRFGLHATAHDYYDYNDEAADFVAMMLSLAEQRELPIYVVMTMRSDFLGDCDAFRGLPEAMNQSQYLVPRLTRQQRREVIEGPIRLYRSEISSRLTDRLLNATDTANDDLPLLQHVLMRSWIKWTQSPKSQSDGSTALDVQHYGQAGTIRRALSDHAEEALEDMDQDTRQLTKRLFQALTQADTGHRRIRRPAKLSEVQAITGASRDQILGIVRKFREDGRSFLVLSPVLSSEDAQEDPVIDISHESLIRQWERLKNWVDEEAESARIYTRLAETARLYQKNQAALYSGADLRVALQWEQSRKPNKAWAERYDSGFDEAGEFLKLSKRKSTWQRFWRFILLPIAVLGLISSTAIYYQWYYLYWQAQLEFYGQEDADESTAEAYYERQSKQDLIQRLGELQGVYQGYMERNQWVLKPGDFKSVTIGDKNHIWGVNDIGEVWRWHDGGKIQGWKPIDGYLDTITAGPDGTVWGVDQAGKLRQWSKKGKQEKWDNVVPPRTVGKLKSLSVGDRKNIWCLSEENEVWRWADGKKRVLWEKIPTQPTQPRLVAIAAGADGTAWAIDQAGKLQQWSEENRRWLPIEQRDRVGRLTSVSVGDQHNVWCLNTKSEIWRWGSKKKKGWQRIEGVLETISVGADGTVWGVASSNLVYSYTSK